MVSVGGSYPTSHVVKPLPLPTHTFSPAVGLSQTLIGMGCCLQHGLLCGMGAACSDTKEPRDIVGAAFGARWLAADDRRRWTGVGRGESCSLCRCTAPTTALPTTIATARHPSASAAPEVPSATATAVAASHGACAGTARPRTYSVVANHVGGWVQVWATAEDVTQYDLFAVAVLRPEAASAAYWAVGEHGTIVHSDDDGVSWALQPPPLDLTAALYGVRYLARVTSTVLHRGAHSFHLTPA